MYVSVGDDDIQRLTLYILYGTYNMKKALERTKLVNGKQVSIESEIQLRRY